MGATQIPKKYQWFFGKEDSMLLKDKEALIFFHYNMALTKTLKMFEYDGLPDTIPYRELEKILQLNSFAYWLKKKDKIYVFWGGLGGRPDEYYRPTNFIVANPYLEFYKTVKVNEEGVLMWNDYAHMGLSLMIRRYAELMAECDITLRFGLINSRLVAILSAMDDTAKASAEGLLEDVEEGRKLGVILGDSWIDENGNVKVYDYRKAQTNDIKDVMELQQYLKASFWNDIGIQANYNMKREAINGNEAGMNEESLKPFVDDMLECRKDAIEKINKQFGLNITVRFSSSWVRRNKIPKDETEEDPKQEETPKKEDQQEQPEEKEDKEE